MDDYAADEEDIDVHDDYFYRWTEWDEDGGAYLHYDPGDDAGVVGPSEPPPWTAPDSPARGRLAAIPEDQPVPGPSRLASDLPPGPEPAKKRARRKKAASESDGEAATGKDISQEELNAKLKAAILRDETLHLRVLRYEVGRLLAISDILRLSDDPSGLQPVHFDVFMKLATDLGIPAKRTGLKGKVRTFLDQKVCTRSSHLNEECAS